MEVPKGITRVTDPSAGYTPPYTVIRREPARVMKGPDSLYIGERRTVYREIVSLEGSLGRKGPSKTFISGGSLLFGKGLSLSVTG